MAAAASFMVFCLVLPLKGDGAFTIYTGFDVAEPTPPRTVAWYSRSTVPVVVKLCADRIQIFGSLVMTLARFIPLNSHDLLQILCIPSHNNKTKGYVRSHHY